MTAPDLPAFLLARISETEADARNAIESGLDQWGATRFEIRFVSPGSLRGDGLGAPVAHGVTSKPVPHIARHDPARVLADCAAKRAVVEHCAGLQTPGLEPDYDDGAWDTAYEVMVRLAQPYASHPDFNPAWRV